VIGARSLSEFLAQLEQRGDLKRVTREVDWAYEVTEIACREARAEGPALLFERVRGARFPLAVNVLAARRRIEWALGRTPGSIGAELEELLHAVPPRALGELLRLRGSAGRLLAMRPSRARPAPSQRHSLGPDLDALPILKLWPRDGGRFVTFPLVLTRHPRTLSRNLGIYRMHVYDAATTGMHWQIGKAAASTTTRPRSRGAGSRSRCTWAPIRRRCWRPWRRCPRESTNWRSPASCAARRRDWRAGARWRWTCWPTPSS